MAAHDNNRTRRVRFANDDELCSYRDGPKELSLSTIIDVWLQPNDFCSLRRSARAASDSAIKKGLHAYIGRTYGYTDDTTVEMYTLWAKCSDTRRGLERFVNKEYGRQRALNRKKLIRGVLYAQNRLRKEGETSYSRCSKIIRGVSMSITEEARKYARMLGKVDHNAISKRRQRPRNQRPPKILPTGRSPLQSLHKIISSPRLARRDVL